MRAIQSILVLLLVVAPGLGAEPAKLRTLAGNTLEGELAGINDKSVQWRGTDGKTAEVPLPEVLDVELQPASPSNPAQAYVEVSLNDGTLLRCSDFSLKRKDLTLKLLSGQEVKLPLSAVSYILRDANDPANHADWLRRLSKQGERDM